MHMKCFRKDRNRLVVLRKLKGGAGTGTREHVLGRTHPDRCRLQRCVRITHEQDAGTVFAAGVNVAGFIALPIFQYRRRLESNLGRSTNSLV